MEKISDFICKFREKGMKHIVIHTIPYRITGYLMKMTDWIGYKIYSNKPMQDVIIIESHNDFDSNGGAFYDYLIANNYNK